jgi:hypothetical protein
MRMIIEVVQAGQSTLKAKAKAKAKAREEARKKRQPEAEQTHLASTAQRSCSRTKATQI